VAKPVNCPALFKMERNGFGAKGLRVARKLFPPKSDTLRVSDAAKQLLAKTVVGVDPRRSIRVACLREMSAATRDRENVRGAVPNCPPIGA